MKKQRYDYSGFSLRRLNDPRFSHVKLLIGWPVYLVMYFLTENLIPLESCHVIHGFLDDVIPFREEFIIFYTGWYLLVIGSLAYSFFYNVEGFRKLQTYIIITQAAAMACYILYPSVQDLRPETFPRENLFTWILGLIYACDTPSGVCPSLHVAYSLGIMSAAVKDEDLSGRVKALISAFALMVCVSVCFVKQHSSIDVAAALPVCLLAEIAVYGKPYWKPKLEQTFRRHRKRLI